jgi:hypothetical protein
VQSESRGIEFRVAFKVFAIVVILIAVVADSVVLSSVRSAVSSADFVAGRTTVTSGGAVILSLSVPPVYDATSHALLLPVAAVASVCGWKCTLGSKGTTATLTVLNHALVLKAGSSTITADGKSVALSGAVRNVLGSLMATPDLVRRMGGTVTVAADGRSCHVVPANPSAVPSQPVASGTADPAAVTRMTKTASSGSKSYTFEIIRIDLRGKGISVVPVAAPGGMNTGSPYTTFGKLVNPLALVNGLPFDTTTHEMTGSLGGGGLYPQVKAGYVETIGVEAGGTPFYAEGRIEVTVDLATPTGKVSMTTYSINRMSWGGFMVLTNWYSKAIWVGSGESLCVVDGGEVVQHVRAATFQPSLMKPGQVAIYAYQTAVNHWTQDTVTPVGQATAVRLHLHLGEHDLAGKFFVQSAPVVLQEGQPVNGADRYPDSFRMTKSGARSFLAIGGGRYLYFISTPTATSLRTDDVGKALASLKLFTHVLSLDGGGSTTLYYKGSYIYTPGRNLVTCLAVPR